MMNKGLVIGLIVFVILAGVSAMYLTKNQQSEEKLYIIEGSVDDLPIEGGVRQAWVDSLYNQSAVNLLYNIENGLKKDNYAGNEVAFFGFALSGVIVKDKNAGKTYEKIKEDILGEDKILRRYLLSLLGEIPTKESLSILLSLVDSDKLDLDKNDLTISQSDKSILYNSIADMPDHARSREGFAVELSPQLEKALKELNFPDNYNSSDENNQENITLSYVYTMTIIKIGAPSGMKLIFEGIKSSNITFEYKDNTDFPDMLVNGERQGGVIYPAITGLSEFRNPDSIPVLKEYLDESSIESATLFSAVYALMSMGQGEGTNVILKWAVMREDNVSPLLEVVLPMIRDRSSEKALRYYSLEEESKTFKNQENKETVLKKYNELLSSRTTVEVVKVN